MCLACYDPSIAESAGINPCHCDAPYTHQAYARIDADLRRREVLGGMAAVVGMFAGFGLAPREARAQTPGRPILLTNLRFFDGTDLSMQVGRDILVENGVITGLPPAGQGPADAQIIDCGGRAVTPGLIDCHWHATLVGVSQVAALTQDIALVHLVSGQEAGATLMRGFTTLRDVGGPVFGLKMAIDRGVVAGPRIFPSGAMISQTSGHGDFRLLSSLPRLTGDADYTERTGVAAIADGRDEVLRRTREQLMRGASQIKIMAGGGVASPYDPLETAQFTLDEMRAAVEAAADYGTYVCAHVYTPTGILRCLEAGVRSIEHGQLADEATIRAMAEAGVWWSLQPFLADEDANQYTDPRSIAKQQQVAQGTVRAFELGRAEGVKMAFGTDVLFNPAGARSQGRQLAKLTRFMSPLEALHMATGAAGELLSQSGTRAPYQGRLGVIAEGALADILVWDGDPESDLDFLGEPETNLRLVMKDGRIYKEQLA
ncbi:metal-dependent hydrolase family protein [Roseicyclus mahoneyensis]|uniref:Imidazolonepropionase-like amidohydrolase n=1 Tax=Roseicyclus mahoneyensis TaxID=164332 RepID=A0A316G3M2_9RHOB|nr:amidohydrolase family protein [Roseicyclus mahoneyensis]PWK55544.1 imidazolonepropionase-like amidohydrolase [Roseicyclus mahoneyensis]